MPQRVLTNGVELAWEELGSGDQALVLIMGIGAQMLWWPDALCQMLAGAGFRVIRFDNRDIGLSSDLAHLPAPNMVSVTTQRWMGRPVETPYCLSDMAQDTVGLLDALGIEAAHIMGASMGGMIAQHIAFEHPERVRSLVSVMSTTGARRVSLPQPKALKALMTPPPADRDGTVEHSVMLSEVLGSKGLGRDDGRIRSTAGRCYDRGRNPRGFARQWGAIMRSGDRTERLRTIQAPTLVLHGTIDPLVPPAGGKATAEAIPGARLVGIENMGHDLPEGAWERIAGEVAAHCGES